MVRYEMPVLPPGRHHHRPDFHQCTPWKSAGAIVPGSLVISRDRLEKREGQTHWSAPAAH